VRAVTVKGYVVAAVKGTAMRIRDVLYGTGIALGLFGAIAVLVRPKPARNYGWVQPGMTPATVDGLLGPGLVEVPGTDGRFECHRERLVEAGQPAADVDRITYWSWNDGSVRYVLGRLLLSPAPRRPVHPWPVPAVLCLRHWSREHPWGR
jgi:hypothetical protein